MIRQAHTYLVGALSGVVVIGIAIAAFVVLVSAQVFHDLPIPALSGGDHKAAAVSQGKALTADRPAVATTGGVGATAQPNHTAANLNAAAGQAGATKAPPAHHQATPATPTRDAATPVEAVETVPTGGPGSADQGAGPGGNSAGSHSSQPSSGSPAPSSSPSGGSGGGGNRATSTSGSSGGGNSNGGGSTTGTGSSGGNPATGTSSGGSTTTSPPPAPVTTGKPLSEEITEGVNGAVGTVDEAVGGTLSETGVSKVTEEVVNGVAGPESVVGKTIDGVGEVVGGLVGGHGR